MSKKLFNDTRKVSAQEAIDFEAKLNGTYVSGQMTASVEVAPMAIEEVTDEQLAKVGQVLTYTDEDGVERTTRSGVFLLNI